jgi:hypothetical protein
MAAYADYAFYIGDYRGNAIAETEFDRLILRASSYIDRITRGQAASYLPAEPVQMAACAVAEAWRVNEQGGELASQSVGSWSRTFAKTKAKNPDARLYDAAAVYLSGTGMMAGWV